MSKRIELEKIESSADSGLRFGTMECRYFPKRLHFHPELELVYINKGEGLCFAGDGITRFKAGDLFFFSANIGHYFKSAPQFYDMSYPLRCGSTYLQFREGVLPADYHTITGCRNIHNLVQMAERGIKWSAQSVDDTIVKQLDMMEQRHGFEALISLFELLNALGATLHEASCVASEQTAQSRKAGDSAYRSVLEYITHNFHTAITLDELASNAGMNRTALCRHFRSHAGRSIFDFLLEFRITYARERLTSTQLPISEISLESGFNNLPNFNVQFKRLTGCTPGEYRLRNIAK